MADTDTGVSLQTPLDDTPVLEDGYCRKHDVVFKEELLAPDKYCCTSNEGKELLSEEKIRIINFITTKSAS